MYSTACVVGCVSASYLVKTSRALQVQEGIVLPQLHVLQEGAAEPECEPLAEGVPAARGLSRNVAERGP